MRGFVGNRPVNLDGEFGRPSVRRDPSSVAIGETGKAGKAFLKAIDGLAFDARVFAYWVTSNATGLLRKRVMTIVIALIRSWAEEYDSGMMDETTTNAKRLYDTVSLFRMEED